LQSLYDNGARSIADIQADLVDPKTLVSGTRTPTSLKFQTSSGRTYIIDFLRMRIVSAWVKK
jgi:hypothetical protein